MPREQEMSLLDSFHALLSELPGVISDRVHLFSLELTQTTQALGKILILLLLSVILAGSAWLALCVGAGAGAIRLGLHWGVVVAIEVITNLALAYWALSKVITLKHDLGFPVTLRHLTVNNGEKNKLIEPDMVSVIEKENEEGEKMTPDRITPEPILDSSHAL